MADPTVARQLVEMLRAAGVERIYGVVGDSLNPIVDAVRHTPGIEWVHVSNEEGGAFAAAAEAQVTGRLAVCAGSCGPGNTHLLQGLYDAHRSGAPVLAIASHIQSQEIGMSFFQETHPSAPSRTAPTGARWSPRSRCRTTCGWPSRPPSAGRACRSSCSRATWRPRSPAGRPSPPTW